MITATSLLNPAISPRKTSNITEKDTTTTDVSSMEKTEPSDEFKTSATPSSTVNKSIPIVAGGIGLGAIGGITSFFTLPENKIEILTAKAGKEGVNINTTNNTVEHGNYVYELEKTPKGFELKNIATLLSTDTNNPLSGWMVHRTEKDQEYILGTQITPNQLEKLQFKTNKPVAAGGSSAKNVGLSIEGIEIALKQATNNQFETTVPFTELQKKIPQLTETALNSILNLLNNGLQLPKAVIEFEKLKTSGQFNPEKIETLIEGNSKNYPLIAGITIAAGALGAGLGYLTNTFKKDKTTQN